MGQKSVPMPVVVSLIAILVIGAVVLLYRGATGGTVGDGHAGRILASPPMPDAAKQQMLQSAQNAYRHQQR